MDKVGAGNNSATLTIGRAQLEKIIFRAVRIGIVDMEPDLSYDEKHAAMVILALADLLKEHCVAVNFELEKSNEQITKGVLR